MKRSLAFQRQSVEHLIALDKHAGDTVIEGAKQAALTLAWFEKWQELKYALICHELKEPELASLARQLPVIREAAE